ncbi:TPA: hypothetical protein KII26_004221 [Escherichia coli]|nr:hypothetical protein [Escherichia coli]
MFDIAVRPVTGLEIININRQRLQFIQTVQIILLAGNGEGWLIGWRSLWYTWGQKETGEWQWTFQVGDLENVNITHWAVMPKAPEAGA